MKKVFTVFLIFTVSYCLHAQTVYLDPDSRKITEHEFNAYKRANLLIVKNDSLNLEKAVFRSRWSETGTIANYTELKRSIESRTGTLIDDMKPVIVIYHPGPDKCNSSGTANTAYKIKWFKDLEKKTLRIAGVKALYFYKTEKGIVKELKSIAWKKDPKAIIEHTFFDFHYPCSSLFVIFNSKGKYSSYFGEFSQAQVLEQLAGMVKEN